MAWNGRKGGDHEVPFVSGQSLIEAPRIGETGDKPHDLALDLRHQQGPVETELDGSTDTRIRPQPRRDLKRNGTPTNARRWCQNVGTGDGAHRRTRRFDRRRDRGHNSSRLPHWSESARAHDAVEGAEEESPRLFPSAGFTRLSAVADGAGQGPRPAAGRRCQTRPRTMFAGSAVGHAGDDRRPPCSRAFSMGSSFRRWPATT